MAVNTNKRAIDTKGILVLKSSVLGRRGFIFPLSPHQKRLADRKHCFLQTKAEDEIEGRMKFELM